MEGSEEGEQAEHPEIERGADGGRTDQQYQDGKAGD
jgi:hypothetical protein